MEKIVVFKSDEAIKELDKIEKKAQQITDGFREQLVSFGKYLLSPEREARIKEAAQRRNQPVNEARSEVYHADIENWKRKKEPKPEFKHGGHC